MTLNNHNIIMLIVSSLLLLFQTQSLLVNGFSIHQSHHQTTFTLQASLSKQHHHNHQQQHQHQSLLFSSNNDNDNDDTFNYNSDTPKLGIELNLDPLTSEQAQSLKDEATQKINEAFSKQMEEIETMRYQMKRDLDENTKSMQFASQLKTQYESEKLMDKIDSLTSEFMKETQGWRESTKLAARADKSMSGKGLDVGSWGKVGGRDVVTSVMMEDGTNVLLGSVSSNQKREKNIKSGKGISSSKEMMNMMEDDDDDLVASVNKRENRILVVCDDKQDANFQKVITRFTSLIHEKITTSTNNNTPSIKVDTYKPTDTIPMGGNSAQCAILVAPSLPNGRSSAEAILSRLLKKTITPGGGGQVTIPPTHLVVLTSLGTSRIDKFPYSMQNMMGGGKLQKQRDVEEVVISTVKGRLVSDSSKDVSLDYTILKLGEIVEDEKVKNNNASSLTIMPGDSLDGQVGIEASANVLFQSIMLRPDARNSTLAVVGAFTKDNTVQDVKESQWEDWFTRLDGPELWRSEDDMFNGILGTTDEELDRKFEELSAYIGEWSRIFDNGAKGTGLTTPVNVYQSSFQPDERSAIVRKKYGVRFEFKQTNTGTSYKSKDEEREFEKMSSTSSSSSSGKNERVVIKESRQRKEGGVEILVEKVVLPNGKKDLRCRARRCNMDDQTVVKELSEEVIVKKAQDAVKVWRKKMLE